MFRFRHVIEQEFQHEGAAEAPPFDFKMRKAVWQVDILNIPDADEGGAAHRIGEAIAPRGRRGGADMLRVFLAEVFAADVLIAGPPLAAGEIAAFVAEEFDFVSLFLGETCKFVEDFVQTEVWDYVFEVMVC